MKKVITLFLLGMILLSATPSYSVSTVFTAIPENYFIPILAGAAVEGLLLGSGVAPMASLYVTVGLALTNEIIGATVFGNSFNWEQAGAASLGASLLYFL